METSLHDRPSIVQKDIVWNLAIGSNMDISKLKARAPSGRLPIGPLCPPIPAVVKNWHLSFDFLFLPPAEPVMAAAMPCANEELHGILYKLTRDDYHTLCMSEGCLKPFSLYKEALVEATIYPSVLKSFFEHVGDNGIVQATVFTLREPQRHSLLAMGLFPSQRYLNLMISGSKAVGLSSKYVEKLEAIPVARPVVGRFRGYARFMTIGLFFCYRSTTLMLLLRRSYRPFLAAVHCRREKASHDKHCVAYFSWTCLLLLTMLPFAVLGFVRALLQRQNVRKIARGEI